MRKRTKENEYIPKSNCFLCKKPASFKDHPDLNKDFICSLCTLVLVNHPRLEGQKWNDLIPKAKKEIDVDLQKDLSKILKI